jgi:uncharacterized protein (TIGR02444 family)
MSLWAWACAAYARPRVAETCLALQDAHGQNTCLLLWALWARPTDAALVARAAAVARAWDAAAISPLRAARRALKAPSPPVADTARERLRGDVKAAELAAERVLLETLEGLGGRGAASPRAALTAASHAWGRAAPDDALAALAAALD